VVERRPAGVRELWDGIVRLPFSDDLDAEAGDRLGLDTSDVDWGQVRRSAYVIHQRITYRYEGPIRRLRQRLVVQPREQHGDQRRVSRSVRIVDAAPRTVRAAPDDFGNHVVDIHVPYVEETVTFISWSVVERTTEHPHIASGALLLDRRLLDPTLLTTVDAELDELIGELRATHLDGGELAAAACQRVFELMEYAHDITTVRTTAAEAFAKRSGVCQDYAHILLTVTRGLGLASRYVSGQLLGVGGSHAWVEVLVPDGRGHARVLALDPTHGRVAGMTYLTIAVGRDYADIAPVSGTYVAPHAGVLTMSKRVSVMRIESADEDELAG
jgi:transglutaminase-like putative cysteine protease